MIPQDLAEGIRAAIRLHSMSRRTEKAYTYWTQRFIDHHSGRHPRDMNSKDIGAFLSHLSDTDRVAAATRNAALDALLFLYRIVLGLSQSGIDGIARTRRRREPPVVFTREEVGCILAQLSGVHWLVVALLYGAGLRLAECLTLRVRDVDFAGGYIMVRDAGMQMERRTILPSSLIEPLRAHLRAVRAMYLNDLDEGHDGAPLSGLDAAHSPDLRGWGLQYVFPATRCTRDSTTGTLVRRHLDRSVPQRAVKDALRAIGLAKPGSPHALRHSFAAHLLESGVPVGTVQELLGHRNTRTTMRYAHVPVDRCSAVSSPLDGITGTWPGGRADA